MCISWKKFCMSRRGDVVYIFDIMYLKTGVAVSLYSSRPDVRNVKDCFEW